MASLGLFIDIIFPAAI